MMTEMQKSQRAIAAAVLDLSVKRSNVTAAMVAYYQTYHTAELESCLAVLMAKRDTAKALVPKGSKVTDDANYNAARVALEIGRTLAKRAYYQVHPELKQQASTPVKQEAPKVEEQVTAPIVEQEDSKPTAVELYAASVLDMPVSELRTKANEWYIAQVAKEHAATVVEQQPPAPAPVVSQHSRKAANRKNRKAA